MSSSSSSSSAAANPTPEPTKKPRPPSAKEIERQWQKTQLMQQGIPAGTAQYMVTKNVDQATAERAMEVRRSCSPDGSPRSQSPVTQKRAQILHDQVKVDTALTNVQLMQIDFQGIARKLQGLNDTLRQIDQTKTPAKTTAVRSLKLQVKIALTAGQNLEIDFQGVAQKLTGLEQILQSMIF